MTPFSFFFVTESEAVKVLGKDDFLIHWKKPRRNKASSYSRDELKELSERLLLRQIKVTVNRPGFRVSTFYIITTLLDEKEYPASELADLYFQRWNVELFFRDIKTTIGMDILRCKTPDMIHKEILMHFIAYNCIRCLMHEAADRKNLSVNQVSFKGTIQALRQWEPHLNQANMNRQKQNDLIRLLYESVAGKVILDRPGRSEPRAVKRRAKPFQSLTAPRHEMKEIKHRNKYHLKTA